MSVAKTIEIISSSPKSFEDAIEQGVSRATDTISDVTGVWLKDQSCEIRDGKITQYKVIMVVTFVLRAPSPVDASNTKK